MAVVVVAIVLVGGSGREKGEREKKRKRKEKRLALTLRSLAWSGREGGGGVDGLGAFLGRCGRGVLAEVMGRGTNFSEDALSRPSSTCHVTR